MTSTLLLLWLTMTAWAQSTIELAQEESVRLNQEIRKKCEEAVTTRDMIRIYQVYFPLMTGVIDRINVEQNTILEARMRIYERKFSLPHDEVRYIALASIRDEAWAFQLEVMNELDEYKGILRLIERGTLSMHTTIGQGECMARLSYIPQIVVESADLDKRITELTNPQKLEADKWH